MLLEQDRRPVLSTSLAVRPSSTATGRLPPLSGLSLDAAGQHQRDPATVRNATVVAEQAVQLLMIPKEIYLNHWHATYTREEFSLRLAEIMPGMAGQASV